MIGFNHRHWRWGLVLSCLGSLLVGATLTQPTRAAEPVVVNAEGYTTRSYGSVTFEGINYAVQSNVANEYVPSMTHSYSDMGSYYLVNSDYSLPNVPNITSGVLWATGNKNRGWAINSLFDGLFHAATYVFVVIGLAILWRTAHRRHLYWSTRLLIGAMLIGFGMFNLVEGIVDHQVLGLHHVNETSPREDWIYWDMGFLAWGAAMLMCGWYLAWRARGVRAAAGSAP